MMTVYLSFVINPEGAIFVDAVHKVHGRKLLKDGFCVFVIDGRHIRCYLKMLKLEDGLDWTANTLRIHYT